jgi:hypothetical protein
MGIITSSPGREDGRRVAVEQFWNTAGAEAAAASSLG